MPQKKSVAEYIDKDLIVELTTAMVKMDSQNPPGYCEHIAKYLKDKCNSLGLKAEIVPMDNKRANVVASYGEGERDIVLSGHFDTVPAGDPKKWELPPLSGEIKNNKIYGRGSADMKGGVATLIAAMAGLKKAKIKLPYRVLFLGTADEEVGMKGASHLQKKGYMDSALCLIITEATDLQVAIAEKGPYWIRINVEGKAARGSMPELGINAIEGACYGINHLKKILPSISHSLVGRSTINVGGIKGGVKTNIVPENCQVEIDIRLVPGVDVDKFDKEIKTLMENLSKEHPCTFSHEVIHSIPPLATNPSEPLVQNFLKNTHLILNRKSFPIGVTYGTDAASLIPPRDIPLVIFGAGNPNIIHKTNEYIDITDLVNASRIIAETIIDTYR
ncbi:MAG: M20 family metallopeptidase [Asgard group archaeon]|nr:M20 family metallopeptidase [Asgard group archaeon]